MASKEEAAGAADEQQRHRLEKRQAVVTISVTMMAAASAYEIPATIQADSLPEPTGPLDLAKGRPFESALSHIQDRGYAKQLLKESFALYKRIGVVFVEMDAVQDGVLVWSRLGWSTHGAGISLVQDEIAQTYAAIHGIPPPPSFAISQFGPDIYDLEDDLGNLIGFRSLQRIARSSQEVPMRLRLDSARAIEVLHDSGIL